MAPQERFPGVFLNPARALGPQPSAPTTHSPSDAYFAEAHRQAQRLAERPAPETDPAAEEAAAASAAPPAGAWEPAQPPATPPGAELADVDPDRGALNWLGLMVLSAFARRKTRPRR